MIDKRWFEYIPIMLIGLFLVEREVEKHAVKISFQIAITIICSVIFFTVLLQLENRYLAIIASGLMWIFLTYVKHCFFNESKYIQFQN